MNINIYTKLKYIESKIVKYNTTNPNQSFLNPIISSKN